MATVITSIGSKSAHTNPVNGQFSFSGTSGSGDPWTGTISHSGASVTANVGDMLYFHQVYFDCMGMGMGCRGGPTDVAYLITAVNSGASTITVKYISGLDYASMGQDPANLSSNSSSLVQAQPYVVRFYSTFNAWEADLDDTSYYNSGDVANGQMYKDSDFEYSGTFYMDGGATLQLTATHLTVAEGERHDGTPNTGVRFLNNGSYQYICMVFQLHYGSNPVVKSLEWVEMDENGKGGGGCTQVLQHYAGGWGASSIGSFNHCMIHNYYMGNISAGDKAGVIYMASQYGQAHNNLLFNIKAGNPTGSNPFLGNLFGITTDRTCVVTNNTVYGLKHVDGTSGEAMGYKDSAYTTQEVYNNICVGNETQDFHDWDGATHSHNLSSDSSATGTGAVTGESAASLFVSTTTGSEDLHLIDGAAALGAGQDLGTEVTAWSADFGGEGTSLTNFYIDIDGRNRDSEGDDWDIGADQCESCSEGGAATGNPAFMLFFD